jgi:hypothetical protein
MEGIVQCTDCGYENPAGHRFCGMCGKALPLPVSVASRATKIDEPAPDYAPDILDRHALANERLRATPGNSDTSISGPSFLGLSDQPSTSEFSYLLEDESRTSPGRLLLAIVIIAAIAAGGWWELRQQHGGKPWLMSLLRQPKQLFGKAEDGVPADRLNRSRAALMQSTNNPNASQEAELQVRDHDLVPKTGESLDVRKPASPNPQSETNGASANESQSSPNQGNAEQAVSKQPAPEAPTPASNSKPDNNGAKVRKSASAESDPLAMKASPGSGAEQALKGDPHNAKPSAKSDADREASNTSDNTASETTRSPGRNPSAADSTTLVAEKYLYGRGVRQDCNRALALLRPAADSNVKARSLLGAMYATGHCVPRDLPRSYHWFALALREEPNNVWVSRNLQSVWNQMSDSEKQLAMRMTK